MPSLIRCFLFLSLTLLTACVSQTPPLNPPLNQSLSWANRQQQLALLTKWNLQGVIGFRTDRDAWSGSLTWQQQDRQHYVITLMGPLGTGAVQISGTAQQVHLATADGKVRVASTPEALLQQTLGWRLPVSSLYYWIRGLPVTGMPSQQSFDSYHHLQTLSQQGWFIQYLGYGSKEHWDLPRKIILSQPPRQLRISIHSW